MGARINIIGIILLSLFVLSACTINKSAEYIVEQDGPSQSEQRSERVNIGAILPLTGAAAQYGMSSQSGIELALQKTKNNIRIVYEDSKSDPKAAVSGLNNMLLTNNPGIILTEYSGAVLAIAPIAEEKRIVQINIGAVNPQIRHSGDYTFSTINDADVEEKELAEFIMKKNITRIAILYPRTSYGTSSYESMEKEFAKDGGIITAAESFEENSNNIIPELIKIKDTKPQAVFLPVVTSDAMTVFKQSREIGFDILWFSNSYIEGDPIKVLSYQPSIIYTSTSLDFRIEDVMKFMNEYKAHFGKNPDIYAATAYDTIKIIDLTITNCGVNPTSIKNCLYNITYDGISGQIKFDEYGSVEKPIIFKTLKDGEFVVI